MDSVIQNKSRKRKLYLQDTDLQIPKTTRSTIKRRLFSPRQTVTPHKSTQRTYVPPVSLIADSQKGIDCSISNSKHDQNALFYDRISQDPPESPTLKLYQGAKISEPEAMLLLFGFIAKHKCTNEATLNLLELVNFFIPEGVDIPQTMYSFHKKFPTWDSISSEHYYCPGCGEYIGEKFAELSVHCTFCDKDLTIQELRNEGNFFLNFDVKSQLESILNNKQNSDCAFARISVRNSPERSGVFEDILDGNMYRNLKLADTDLICTFNTDGVPLFKSSKFSIWPILLSLNELTYPLRYRSTFIAALWFGKCKPNFDTFFDPFVCTSTGLSKSNKVVWKHNEQVLKSNVYFPILVTDTVARCMCQGLTQFNGSYGCTWCLRKGESLKLPNNKSKWVYPEKGELFEERTKSEFLGHLKEYSRQLVTNPTQKSHMGVKAASKLLLLPQFDIVNGFVFDYMHTAFLGVARALTNAWLDSKNHSSAFYIGLRIKEIDQKLLCFMVPNYFSRSIRSINDRAFWKASEWRTWAYVSIIVLKNILPLPYLLNFSKFVTGIMKLSGQSVSQSDIVLANALLQDFVKGVTSLYGPEFGSFNCHALLHASKCVENWGPLWSYSAFQFENYNGVLLNLFNGSQKIEMQISNRINEALMAMKLCNEMAYGPPVEYFLRLVKHNRPKKNYVKTKSCLLFGHGRYYHFRKEESIQLTQFGITNKIGKCFKSCYVNSLTFTILNETSRKRCNCITEVNGQFFIIRKLLISSSVPVCFATHIKARQNNINPFSYDVVSLSKKVSIIPINQLKSKFLCSKCGPNFITLVKLPNNVESD